MAESEQQDTPLARPGEEIPKNSLYADPQKLLHWVIKETANVSYNNLPDDHFDDHDYSGVTRLVDLSPEEREQWMNAIFGRPEDRISDGQRMRMVLTSLLDDMEKPKGEKMKKEDLEDLLQNLHFLCEMSHIARNLPPAGGLKPVFFFCQHKNESIREHASWILHTCSGNNQQFKQKFLEAGGVDQMFKFIDSEKSWIVQKKLLGVLLNMCRNFQPGLIQFLKQGGLRLVSMFLKAKAPEVQERCLRFFPELFNENAVTRDQLQQISFPKILSDALTSDQWKVRAEALNTVRHMLDTGFIDVVDKGAVSALVGKVVTEDFGRTEEYRAQTREKVQQLQSRLAEK